MDGIAAASQLIAPRRTRSDDAIRFEVALPHHDAALRRLLRENPMPGQIRLSFEREPSYFAAAAMEGSEHQTIIATRADCVICAGSISTRRRFINGTPTQVGYLGGLRLDASCRGRASIIRRGYELFRQLHEQGGPPIYLTSIVGDNLPARRFLERGVRGMPTYRFLGEFVTLAIGRRRRGDPYKPTASVRRKIRDDGLDLAYGSDQQKAELVRLLNRHHEQYQFSPVWSAAELQPEDFNIICSRGDAPVACAAFWDQRGMKQTVVRGYSNRLRWFRPLINLGATLSARPCLPRIGQQIPHAFVSHLAVDLLQPEIAEWLIHLLHGRARRRQIDYLTIGFDARDPILAHLRKVFRPREYVSRLYVVHWDDGAELAESLDDRLLAPEVALL